MDDESRNAAGERARVLNEIERLSGICGSVTKAVKTMRGGTYSARMKGVSDATWRKYYYDWQSAKRRRQLLKHSRPKMIGDGINVACEPVNGANETINCDSETINETIKSLIARNLGIAGTAIVSAIDKSRASIMRAIAQLKKDGLIEYPGSKKTGGYYAIEEGISEHSAADCGIMALFNENTAL